MEKVKVVINTCWGGFGLSTKAMKMLGVENDTSISRDDPKLIEIVERLGFNADGQNAHLEIVEAIVHPEFQWEIFDYDGKEKIVYLPK